MERALLQLNTPAERVCRIEDQIWTQILELLAGVYPREDVSERRRDKRYPFPCLIYLTPVGEVGVARDGELVVAVGKDLSEGGLGFYHSEPLPSQRMNVSIETADGRWLGFLFESVRSRPLRQGWHETNGRLVECAPSRMESDGCLAGSEI
jgi:hypothetical protein